MANPQELQQLAALEAGDSIAALTSILAVLPLLPPSPELDLVILSLTLLLHNAMSLQEEFTHQAYLDRSLEPRGRGPYSVPKSTDFLLQLLDLHSDRVFRNMLRMSKSSFLRLVDFLSPNSVFVPKGRGRPPAAARIQIAAFLLRVGSLGTYASSALQACISEGSIYAYCNNVVKALLDRLKDVVQMPSLERRAEIAEDIGLPGCVGAIDGSLIPLENAPSQHASSYYNGRLKRHCLNLQVVGDFDRNIISFECGAPGSNHDSNVFLGSQIYRNRRTHFDTGDAGSEYLLADKGYLLTSITMRSFTTAEIRNFTPEQKRLAKKYNRYITRRRSFIEHIFGSLKGRFKILNSLPGDNYEQQWRMISALLVLHNLLQGWGDAVGDMDDWEGDEKEGGVFDGDTAEDREEREENSRSRGDEASERQQGVALRWKLAEYIDQIS